MEPEAMTGGATGYKSQMAYEPESFIGRSYGVEPEAMTGVVGGASVYGVRASVYRAFELGMTGLGLGLGDFGTKDFGLGLDNF